MSCEHCVKYPACKGGIDGEPCLAGVEGYGEPSKQFWEGDWTDLPRHCDGYIDVMDQTIGCYKCGMNIWHMPEFGQWPVWDVENEPPADWWDKTRCDYATRNRYQPYDDLLFRVHPNGYKEDPVGG